MKRPIAVLATIALSLGAIASIQDSLTLTRTFSEGSTDSYAVSMKAITNTDMSAFGQESMSVEMNMTQTAEYTYKKVKEDGSADMAFKYKDIEVKLEGPMAEMMGGGEEMPKEMSGTAKIDKFGRITESKFDDAKTAAMLQMFGGSSAMDSMTYFSFPENAVKVGEEFEIKMPDLPMFEKGGSKITAKVVGSETWKDIDAWKIESTGKFKMNLDMGKMMQEAGNDMGMNMLMTGTVNMKSTAFVEKSTGRLLEMEVSSDSDSKVKLVDMGMELPVTSDTVAKITLKK